MLRLKFDLIRIYCWMLSAQVLRSQLPAEKPHSSWTKMKNDKVKMKHTVRELAEDNISHK